MLLVVVAASLAGVSLVPSFFLVEGYRALCLRLGYRIG